MWNTALAINTVLFSIASVFLIYSFGKMILFGSWQQFLITLLVWALLLASTFVFSVLE